MYLAQLLLVLLVLVSEVNRVRAVLLRGLRECALHLRTRRLLQLIAQLLRLRRQLQLVQRVERGALRWGERLVGEGWRCEQAGSSSI